MPISKHTKLLPYRRKPSGEKYELLFSDSRTVEDVAAGRLMTLYRIRALRAVGLRVRKGDLGGYVQSLDNLAQDGDCWLADQACALGCSRIWGQAWVGENALLRDQAWAFENARISGQSVLCGAARVFGHARISGQSFITGHTMVSGQAVIGDNAHLLGNCWVSGGAKVGGDLWCAGSQIMTEGDWRGTP
jgi:carbonic anhydrase/acetyltransferase-like protein (isoleucine patch superfamily)